MIIIQNPFSSVQIAALESELMQLMKQNGIQVNNNNNNGVNSRAQLSERGAAPQCPERRLAVGGEPQNTQPWHCTSVTQECINYSNDCL